LPFFCIFPICSLFSNQKLLRQINCFNVSYCRKTNAF
jgi:hypothetical protein